MTHSLTVRLNGKMRGLRAILGRRDHKRFSGGACVRLSTRNGFAPNERILTAVHTCTKLM